MKPSRISADHLRWLRNQIPIDRLIETLFMAPGTTCQGPFRFACPQCHSHDTSIKKKTNLARCFECKKNFNTIDMVMAVKKIIFVDAVSFLDDYSTDLKTVVYRRPVTDDHPAHPSSHVRPSVPIFRRGETQPVSLSQILSGLVERTRSNTTSSQKCCDGCLSLTHRLNEADKQIAHLKLLVSNLQHIFTEQTLLCPLNR